jgi:phenylacetate-CoA ligase
MSTSDKLYEIMPTRLQNLAVSYYGLRLYLSQYGPKFQKELEKFGKMQWYPPERLRQYQDEKLALLIRHCYDNVPYYRRVMNERKLTPDDIRTVGDLTKMPILTKEDVRSYKNELVAVNYRKSQLIHGHTNGTTGSPLEVIWDNTACLIKNVVDWRQKGIAGIRLGDKIASFLSRQIVPINRTAPPFWRYNLAFNHLLFSVYHLSRSSAAIYLRKLKDFRPRAIEGYPSSLYLIAALLQNLGEVFPVDAVFCSSEPLFPSQRALIEKSFACKVYDYYGMAERVVFATECEYHHGKHINTDYAITEIIYENGELAPDGRMGRMIGTGLYNFAMPLIRYKTSDITAIKPDRCACGRAFPLMNDVTARDVEILTRRDGRYIIPAILSGIYDHLSGISELQTVQEDRDSIVINIVKLPDYQEKNTSYLLNEYRKIVGDDMNISIKFVDAIPRTPAGKFRWVISKVPLEI